MTEKQKCVHHNQMYDQSNYFSYHTVEFKLQLHYDDYNYVYSVLSKHKSKSYPEENGNTNYFHSEILISQGVRITLVRINRPNCIDAYPYFGIKLIVNPRLLVMDTSHIGIFVNTPENVKILVRKLNECLERIGLKRYRPIGRDKSYRCHITDFRISRVDLCVNHKFIKPEYAEIYLKLMKRGSRLSFTKLSAAYDKTSKRQKPRKNELRYCAKSFDFVVYNKFEQMLDNIGYFEHIPDEAYGLLRFEIQLKESKIDYIRKNHFEYESFTGFLRVLGDVAFREFSRYSQALFCNGSYFDLNTARNIIREMKCRKADEIIAFLEDVSDSRSLEACIQKYETSGKKYKGILRKLEELNINPVTIPGDWGIFPVGLPSVPRLLGLTPARPSDDLAEEAFNSMTTNIILYRTAMNTPKLTDAKAL